MHGGRWSKSSKQTPGHAVNGADVDRSSIQMIEAGEVSARNHHFPEKGPAFSEPRKREPWQIHARIGQSAVAAEDAPAQVLEPLGWICRPYHKEGAMVWAFTSSKDKGRCRKNRALIAKNFEQWITADLAK
jgi:hypothetical protein